MFGKILGIDNGIIEVENTLKKAEIGLVNYHVVFIEDEIKFIGVIVDINEAIIKINLIGEIINEKFVLGIVKKPKLNSSCRLITKKELEYILGSQDYANKNNLLIGNSVIYDGFKVTVNKDDFLSNHFAILGNTGAGKSCCVARILQNIFYYNDDALPKNAHFIIFDAYGEYDSALANINRIPGLGYKKYLCESRNGNKKDLLKFPSYFLGVSDLALLLDVDSPTMIPVIENTLRLTFIFTSKDKEMIKYKNNIIARSIQDILFSGKSPNQIVDQILAVLTKFNTEDLNLNSIIAQPGYNRTLRQCLNINEQGKINAINLVIDFLSQFTKVYLDNIDISKVFIYSLEDLYNALEFSLINEGVLTSDTTYEKLNTLKVRLHAIINSDINQIFNYNEVVTKTEYIKNFFKLENGNPCQIVDVSFDSVDERYAKILTKIFSKLFFDYVTNILERTSFPIHIIIEEAHRYVQNDNDVNIIGYNIFDKITKQGRKYGMILGLITQRPNELSKTVLSQCSNFIVFRLYHPEDVNIVLSLSTVMDIDASEKIKILHSGTSLCFGTAFKIPVLTKFDLPDPMPTSTNVSISNVWYK